MIKRNFSYGNKMCIKDHKNEKKIVNTLFIKQYTIKHLSKTNNNTGTKKQTENKILNQYGK